MRKDELIEAARLAYVEAWESEDAYLTMNNHPKTSHQRSRAGIIAALEVFEQAHTPTDDERDRAWAEYRARPDYEADDPRGAFDAGFDTRRTVQGEPTFTDAVSVAPVPEGCPGIGVQGEPTDAQVLAGLNAAREVDWRQGPWGNPPIPSTSLTDWHWINVERMRAALRAAAETTSETAKVLDA